jgi:hypothetical protein
VGGTDKLGTFAGVFVPVTLNVLSILMFLRFGFILGQTGVVGMMGKSFRVAFSSEPFTVIYLACNVGVIVNVEIRCGYGL